ncbi:DegV family protein [Marinobacter bohaiensis]|uniref:DegV family protein n=1 Tax=Marinobacter bohaiensis TaxID=2201898 RepID=UPI000DACACE3|nr:DegV family protein [Marinobacter bohaiensis]
MRVGLIVDSACDLPYDFSRDKDIFILPVTAKIDGQTYVDDHSPETTARFYDSGLLQKGHHAETEAYSAQQIHDLFLERIVTEYDVAICETVTRSRSLVYQNATEAMNSVMSHYQPVREAAGRDGKFSMRVIDSKQLFSGQGLLAAHTLRLIEDGLGKNELRQQVEAFTDRIYTCAIPRDLHYLRERARRRGDKSISAVVAFLGKALNVTPVLMSRNSEPAPVAKTLNFNSAAEKVINYADSRVKAGLLTPYVVLSCGFSWEEIEALPGLDRLRETCAEHKVELLISQMGITSSIYLGPGSLCLSLAAEDHNFSDHQ